MSKPVRLYHLLFGGLVAPLLHHCTSGQTSLERYSVVWSYCLICDIKFSSTAFTHLPKTFAYECVWVCVRKRHNISNSSVINILIPHNYTGSDTTLRWAASTLPDNYIYQTNWEVTNEAEMKAKARRECERMWVQEQQMEMERWFHLWICASSVFSFFSLILLFLKANKLKPSALFVY